MLDPSTEGKVCSVCKEWKLFYMFSKRKEMIDKHKSQCKECDALRRATYYHSPRGKETISRYVINNWVELRIRSARHRAKKRKWPFNLTAEYIKSIAPTNMKCPALGIKMIAGEPIASAMDTAPSLDRLIPELGYVKGNVVVVSNRANRIKNDSTPEELMSVAKFYAKIFKEQNPSQLTLDL